MECDLKVSAGRPPEDAIPRINLKHYRREAKFRRKLSYVFKYWEAVVHTKSKGNPKYIANFEALFGEIIDKYGELSRVKQKRAFRMKYPIRLIFKLTNLNLADVFPKDEDNEAFREVLLTQRFTRDQFIKR